MSGIDDMQSRTESGAALAAAALTLASKTYP